MTNQNFEGLQKKKGSFALLLVILSVFLVVLTISTAVGIQNKIKEGRYIDRRLRQEI